MLLASALLLLTCSSAEAQEPTAELSLPNLIHEVLERNPAVKGAAHELETKRA